MQDNLSTDTIPFVSQACTTLENKNEELRDKKKSIQVNYTSQNF